MSQGAVARSFVTCPISVFQIEIQIEIGIETGTMTLGHEKLDVYQKSIGCVAWVYGKADSLNGIHRPARDQWLRASQSISLNIAEGNGKTAEADRRRYFEIARGSAMECAAIQDVLVAGKVLDQGESHKQIRRKSYGRHNQ